MFDAVVTFALSVARVTKLCRIHSVAQEGCVYRKPHSIEEEGESRKLIG